MYYSSVGTLYIYLGSPSTSASESGYLPPGLPLQKIKSRETAPGPLRLRDRSPPAPSTMTQPTGTTPLTPGEQLLNPDIEHIEIPQQQQQPETWTVWVETYVNARIQHEVVHAPRGNPTPPRSCPGTRNATRCRIRSPSVRLQGKPRLRSSMDPANPVKPSPTHAASTSNSSPEPPPLRKQRSDGSSRS